jgi:hypothetical protein
MDSYGVLDAKETRRLRNRRGESRCPGFLGWFHLRTCGAAESHQLIGTLNGINFEGKTTTELQMKEIPMGGFASAYAQMRHYAECQGVGVVQMNGVAPFVLNFVGPDDPGPAKEIN